MDAQLSAGLTEDHKIVAAGQAIYKMLKPRLQPAYVGASQENMVKQQSAVLNLSELMIQQKFMPYFKDIYMDVDITDGLEKKDYWPAYAKFLRALCFDHVEALKSIGKNRTKEQKDHLKLLLHAYVYNVCVATEEGTSVDSKDVTRGYELIDDIKNLGLSNSKVLHLLRAYYIKELGYRKMGWTEKSANEAAEQFWHEYKEVHHAPSGSSEPATLMYSIFGAQVTQTPAVASQGVQGAGEEDVDAVAQQTPPVDEGEEDDENQGMPQQQGASQVSQNVEETQQGVGEEEEQAPHSPAPGGTEVLKLLKKMQNKPLLRSLEKAVASHFGASAPVPQGEDDGSEDDASLHRHPAVQRPRVVPLTNRNKRRAARAFTATTTTTSTRGTPTSSPIDGAAMDEKEDEGSAFSVSDRAEESSIEISQITDNNTYQFFREQLLAQLNAAQKAILASQEAEEEDDAYEVEENPCQAMAQTLQERVTTILAAAQGNSMDIDDDDEEEDPVQKSNGKRTSSKVLDSDDEDDDSEDNGFSPGSAAFSGSGFDDSDDADSGDETGVKEEEDDESSDDDDEQVMRSKEKRTSSKVLESDDESSDDDVHAENTPTQKKAKKTQVPFITRKDVESIDRGRCKKISKSEEYQLYKFILANKDNEEFLYKGRLSAKKIHEEYKKNNLTEAQVISAINRLKRKKWVLPKEEPVAELTDAAKQKRIETAKALMEAEKKKLRNERQSLTAIRKKTGLSDDAAAALALQEGYISKKPAIPKEKKAEIIGLCEKHKMANGEVDCQKIASILKFHIEIIEYVIEEKKIIDLYLAQKQAEKTSGVKMEYKKISKDAGVDIGRVKSVIAAYTTDKGLTKKRDDATLKKLRKSIFEEYEKLKGDRTLKEIKTIIAGKLKVTSDYVQKTLNRRGAISNKLTRKTAGELRQFIKRIMDDKKYQLKVGVKREEIATAFNKTSSVKVSADQVRYQLDAVRLEKKQEKAAVSSEAQKSSHQHGKERARKSGKRTASKVIDSDDESSDDDVEESGDLLSKKKAKKAAVGGGAKKVDLRKLTPKEKEKKRKHIEEILLAEMKKEERRSLAEIAEQEGVDKRIVSKLAQEVGYETKYMTLDPELKKKVIEVYERQLADGRINYKKINTALAQEGLEVSRNTINDIIQKYRREKGLIQKKRNLEESEQLRKDIVARAVVLKKAGTTDINKVLLSEFEGSFSEQEIASPCSYIRKALSKKNVKTSNRLDTDTIQALRDFIVSIKDNEEYKLANGSFDCKKIGEDFSKDFSVNVSNEQVGNQVWYLSNNNCNPLPKKRGEGRKNHKKREGKSSRLDPVTAGKLEKFILDNKGKSAYMFPGNKGHDLQKITDGFNKKYPDLSIKKSHVENKMRTIRRKNPNALK